MNTQVSGVACVLMGRETHDPIVTCSMLKVGMEDPSMYGGVLRQHAEEDGWKKRRRMAVEQEGFQGRGGGAKG